MLLEGKNTIVIDKKAYNMREIQITEEGIFVDAIGLVKKEHIFACLHCEELRNITLIVLGKPVSQVTFIFATKELFGQVKGEMVDAYSGMDVSEQNRKINGYAAAIVAKLKEGIVTGIVETKEKSDNKECPVCGMQCEADAAYCMECGATI